MRLIDADAFCAFLRETSTRQHYERLLTHKEKYPTVADVIEAICCDLDGTSLNGLDNAPTVDISKEVWNKSNELLNKRLSYLEERPRSSLERPLYEGVLFVDDYGINKVIEVDENGTVTAQRIISRDTFIEAYNKFIKGE